MYLDRTYKPRRRRRGWPLWPFILAAIIAIVLYEQQPAWLLQRTPAPTPEPTRSGVSYLAEAQTLMESGNYAGAAAAYEQMIRLEPDNARGYVKLSQLQLILQDIARAEEYGRRAVELAPGDPEGMTALAHALDWQGELEDALDYGLDALELAPDNATTLAVVAEIYIDVGNWDMAQSYLDGAFAQEPNNVYALRNQAYLYERRGAYEEAIAAYDRAIGVAPHRFDLHIEKARQYRIGLLDYTSAVESYRHAVEAYPSAVTLDALGEGLYNIGDHLSAVRELRKAIELDPNYGPAQVHLGMALYARRNYEDAVPALEKGLTLLGDKARVEQLYTLGLAYVYKEPPECAKAQPWLLKALQIDSTSGPALSGLASCGSAPTPAPGEE